MKKRCKIDLSKESISQQNSAQNKVKQDQERKTFRQADLSQFYLL